MIYVCMKKDLYDIYKKFFNWIQAKFVFLNNGERGENRIWSYFARNWILGISTMVGVQHIFFFYKILLKYRTNIYKPLCQFMQHLSKNASTKEMKIELKRQNFVDTLPMAESLSQWPITAWPMFNWQPRSAPLVRGLAPAHYRYLNISAFFFHSGPFNYTKVQIINMYISHITFYCMATLDFCWLVHSHITVFRNYQISTSDIIVVQYFPKRVISVDLGRTNHQIVFKKSPKSTVVITKDQRGIITSVVNFSEGQNEGDQRIKRLLG